MGARTCYGGVSVGHYDCASLSLWRLWSSPGVWVSLAQFSDDGTDALGEEVGFDDGGMCAPTEDPAFDFFESEGCNASLPGGENSLAR